MNWNDHFQGNFEAFLRARTPSTGRLTEALLYAIQSPGKRLRARFASESGALAGLDPLAVQAFSFAIEFVHLFSLVHDDLPCLDNDDLRRGIPTVHKKFDEATALLVGDALLSLALEAFLEASPHVEPSAFVEAYRFFLQATGPLGMIGGQSEELEIGTQANLDELLKIQDLKTGALFRAALAVPFLLNGTSRTDSRYPEILTFASDFGFAYQIADDLEDETQDQATNSKNILSLMGRDSAKKAALQRLTQTSVSANFSATKMLQDKLR